VSAASLAYTRLSNAFMANVPECHGLELFTAENLSAADIEVLTAICDACPLYELCDTYARTARVTAGFWAGKKYPKGRGAQRSPKGKQMNSGDTHA
jgi:hypothetical protein